MRIDAHNHLGVRHGASQDAAELVTKLDQAGVSRAVVFPFVEGDFDNDDIDRAMEAAPDRLIPFCAVNPWGRESAVREIKERAERGFRGIKLHPTIHGYHLSDPGLVDPIFDAVREAGMVVISHGASDLYNAPPEFARIAMRFPEVPLMMAHSGTFWSHDQAIEVAREVPNVYLETARVPMFEVTHSVRELGPEKVVWGTDSPFVDYEFEYDKMERAASSSDAHQMLVGGTLAGLLGILG